MKDIGNTSEREEKNCREIGLEKMYGILEQVEIEMVDGQAYLLGAGIPVSSAVLSTVNDKSRIVFPVIASFRVGRQMSLKSSQTGGILLWVNNWVSEIDIRHCGLRGSKVGSKVKGIHTFHVPDGDHIREKTLFLVPANGEKIYVHKREIEFYIWYDKKSKSLLAQNCPSKKEILSMSRLRNGYVLLTTIAVLAILAIYIISVFG